MTNANDIRDIKPPVEIPNGWEWLWWTLGVLAVAALLFAAWRWWQKRRSQIPIEPPVPAHIHAKQKLQEALALIARPKPFCILVSDTLRLYLEERGDELVLTVLSPDYIKSLSGILPTKGKLSKALLQERARDRAKGA